MRLKLPPGRTRFQTSEAIRLLGIPEGSQPAFHRLLLEADERPVEVIGQMRTFDPDQIRRLAKVADRMRASGQLPPSREPEGPRGRKKVGGKSVAQLA